jgi:plasmid stabilization system protein ParE
VKRRIRISSLAIRQFDRASAWWRRNRHKAPDALDVDFDEGLEVIRENPDIGRPVPARPGMRRLWLERIRYYIYYRVRPEDDIVEVTAFWHASRRPPRL